MLRLTKGIRYPSCRKYLDASASMRPYQPLQLMAAAILSDSRITFWVRNDAYEDLIGVQF